MKSESIRLQKFLSQCGVASRRAAELLIQEGKIRVNGVIVRELGTKVDPSVDKISFQGKEVQTKDEHSYILLHKPRGFLVTRKDPHGRKTVYHLIPDLHDSIKTVGRLDYDSEGLLLLTNDGELAYRLTHPSYEIKKLYHVQLDRLAASEKIKQLERGILLEDEQTAPSKIKTIPSPTPKKNEIWCSIEIHEGKKRQIRRMFEWAGVEVLRLIRVKIASLMLEDLKVGKWRSLSSEEVKKLKREVNIL